MTDARVAIVGLGSAGGMALWQAARRFGGAAGDVVGFEAATPGHGRSAVGGDTRLFRMTYRDDVNYTPLLTAARRLWGELEEESGRQILNRCGGLSIGARDGAYVPKVLERARETGTEVELLEHDALAARYPQHALRPGDCAVYDPYAGYLRTDAAVWAATAAARARGAHVHEGTPVDGIREEADGVTVTSGGRAWRFDRVIVAAGGWSGRLLPSRLAAAVHPRRIYLTWFVARRPELFAPERFPVFIRIEDDRSLYGAPSTDGVTVKVTLDGRSAPTADPSRLDRELTAAEIAETHGTVTEFLPDLAPGIARSDAFPDLYTADGIPMIGPAPGGGRVIVATGFSGMGFKISPASGAYAVALAAGEPVRFPALDPGRFA